MNWQDYIVGAIGLAVAFGLLRWAWSFVRGRHGGCPSCDSKRCPLRNKPKKQKKETP